MCGIAGIIEKTGKPAHSATLRKMCQLIHHRGPDDRGYYLHENVGLGICRLSIIDLNTGHQPIHNEAETVWIVLNGEIYNYQELRKDLLKKGHHFYTQTDTEVIVHLYEEYGEACINYLRGMFAFALYDLNLRKFFLVRDRIGIKPVFYFENGQMLAFGSEIKCLLADPRVPKELDVNALDSYLSLLYIPAPESVFKKIQKILPGHYLVWDGRKTEIKKYWELEYKIDRKSSFEDLTQVFLEKFREAVKLRMISDVPLGVLLSGGIDSSAIVATMSEYSELPVETFTIGYGQGGYDFDETNYAKSIAYKFSTHHHEEIVAPKVQQLIPEIIHFFDEPFADSSAIPNLIISKIARQRVTVALSGLGGDEIAAGYNRHLALQWLRYYFLLPKLLREKVAVKLADWLPDSSKGSHFLERIKKFIHNGIFPMGKAYLGFTSFLLKEQKKTLYTQEFLDQLNGSYEEKFNSYFENDHNLNWLNKALFVDLKMYLPDDLLILTDRTSMANSLEVRTPYLDHKLVEFMATIPPEYKVNGQNKKYLFKMAFKDILPKEIVHRRKQGFSIPLVLWFRKELKTYLESILCEENIARTGFFNPTTVKQMIDAHLSGKENYNLQLWSLIIFVLWHQKNMENGA